MDTEHFDMLNASIADSNQWVSGLEFDSSPNNDGSHVVDLMSMVQAVPSAKHDPQLAYPCDS